MINLIDSWIIGESHYSFMSGKLLEIESADTHGPWVKSNGSRTIYLLQPHKLVSTI